MTKGEANVTKGKTAQKSNSAPLKEAMKKLDSTTEAYNSLTGNTPEKPEKPEKSEKKKSKKDKEEEED